MMNNEPVAWMQIHYKDKMCITKYCPVKTWEDDIPLYTHPAKTKDESYEVVFDGEKYTTKLKEPANLTDEKIHKIAQKHFHVGLGINPLDFARAILKEAQEK